MALRTVSLLLVGGQHDAVETALTRQLRERPPLDGEVVFWESSLRDSSPEWRPHWGLELLFFARMNVVFSMIAVARLDYVDSMALGHGPDVEKARARFAAHQPDFTALGASDQLLVTLAVPTLRALRRFLYTEPAQALAQAAEYFGEEAVARAFLTTLTECMARLSFNERGDLLALGAPETVAALRAWIATTLELLWANEPGLPRALRAALAVLHAATRAGGDRTPLVRRLLRSVAAIRDAANWHYVQAVVAQYETIERVVLVCGEAHTIPLYRAIARVNADLEQATLFTNVCILRLNHGHVAMEEGRAMRHAHDMLARVDAWRDFTANVAQAEGEEERKKRRLY